MEHLLQKSKRSIFHNIFKYMIFQRRQKALLWSKGLTTAESGELVHPMDMCISQFRILGLLLVCLHLLAANNFANKLPFIHQNCI